MSIARILMGIKRVKPAALILAASLALGAPTTGGAAEASQIHRGMTEAQVQKVYGEPDQRTETDSGMTWTYVKGMSKAFIPFYAIFGHPIKMIVVNFRHGRVASYAVQQ